jgi:hypothetical protein
MSHRREAELQRLRARVAELESDLADEREKTARLARHIAREPRAPRVRMRPLYDAAEDLLMECVRLKTLSREELS